MRFAEFFAGGGMARAGFPRDWQCAFANDIDDRKCTIYAKNWGGDHLHSCDIRNVDPKFLHQEIDLYWASSPCQDFSLAGNGTGLKGTRSGVFFSWANLLKNVVSNGFAPKIIAFENVTGLASRRNGDDLVQVLQTFTALGYKVGAMEIDAARYLPQSRKRLFVVAVRDDLALPDSIKANGPIKGLHSARIEKCVEKMGDFKRDWIWFNLPAANTKPTTLIDFLEYSEDLDWFSKPQINRLLSLMSPINASKVEKKRLLGKTVVGTVFKRGRPDETGKLRQSAEVRFDGLSGCLRTPGGGSSKQTLLFVNGRKTRARLMTPRETANLMGLSADYALPENRNDAYHLTGDGVVVPVVRHLADQLFLPILNFPIANEEHSWTQSNIARKS